MAGRKKGANKSKHKGHLQLGDLVLAKVKGFPAWPAKISMPEEWDRVPDPKKFFVQFFGTQEIAFVAPAEIQEFNNEVKIKVRARCQGKTVKYFAQAVQEICEEFDHQQQSSGAGVGPNHELEGEELGFRIKDENDTEVSEGTDGYSRHNHEENDKDRDINPIILNCSLDHSHDIPTQEKDTAHSDGSGLAHKNSIHFNHERLADGSKTDVDDDYNNNIVFDGGITSSTVVNDMNDCCARLQDPQEGSGQSLSLNIHQGGNRSFSSGRNKRSMVNGAYNSEDGHSGDNKFSKVGSELQTSLGQAAIEPHENKLNTRTRVGGRNGAKKLSGFNKLLNDEHDSRGDVLCYSELRDDGNISKTRKRGSENQKLVDGADLKPSAKKKKSVRPIHPTSRSMEKYPELKNSALHQKSVENLTLREDDVASSGATCDEAALPLTKRRRRAFEAMVDSKSAPFESTSTNKSITVQKFIPRAKRRALCIDDDDDEEPRTPIHGGFNPTSSMVNSTPQILKNTPEFHDQIPSSPQNSGKKSSDPHVINHSPKKPIAKKSNCGDGISKEFISPMKQLKELSSPRQENTSEKKPKKATPALHGQVVEKSFLKEAKPALMSPRKVATSVNVSKSPKKYNIAKPLSKASSSVSQKKQYTLLDKGSGSISKSSRNQTSAPMKKPASGGEISKQAASRNTYTNNNLVLSEPVFEVYKRTNDCPTASVSDTKMSQSIMSMKHLIAAAQAKRRQAQTQVMSQNTNSSAFILHGRTSPSSGSVIQPFSSSNNTMQHREYDFFSSHTMEVVSPSTHFQQLPLHQPDAEESDEIKISSGHYEGDGSLSGGTEAAVSRDAFEGMIETLSRTKESIGRATRLAIDCAKYGITNEVVELLVRKLETETSFHRKVDLFFLVDSITQCSHNQKGIAGASYIPIVQSALPRLLAAAAPPGIGGHENRRQCLKVLRLWLERKIMPDIFLRRYMEEMGGSNNDMNAGVFLRRPSRAERAVDDPIREMEGMFVDEYGSNASFQLPGFLYSRMFEDGGDEEPELEYKEIGGDQAPAGPIFDCKETEVSHVGEELEGRRDSCGSPVGVTCGVENPEVTIDISTNKFHHLSSSMVGDLHVGDGFSQLKNGKPLTGDSSVVMDSQCHGCGHWSMDSTSNSTLYRSPFSDGSPPLPLDPPSPLPPLPSSPESPNSFNLAPPSPPPLPPRSPSPPPPPPPLSLLNVPLPPILSLPPPRPVLLSAPTPVTHQHPLHNALPDGANGSQPLPMVHIAQGQQVDAAINVKSGIFIQHLPCFNGAGVQSLVESCTHNSSGLVDYALPETPLNSQSCQVNRIYQGNATFPQNNFNNVPHPRTPSCHLLPQHPHLSAYTVVPQPDGHLRYGTDKQWRTPSNKVMSDGHRSEWMNGGQTFGSRLQLTEGHFQAPADRISNDSKGFRPGTFPSGSEISVGPGVSLIMPCRSDIPSTNCWRPT